MTAGNVTRSGSSFRALLDSTRLFHRRAILSCVSPPALCYFRTASRRSCLAAPSDWLLIDKQLGVSHPLIWAYLAVFAESVVALCLAIGLFTRLAALILAVYMAILVFFFQWQFGYFWTNRGYEYALLWCLLCIGIFFRGGGRYSVDRLLGKEF